MRLLVAEDVERLADDIAEGLRDQGFAVDVAHDGLEAATKIEINDYDVVILDRDLPRVHGDTLAREVTKLDGAPMILMLTAAGTIEDKISGLSLGADDYLPKPFDFTELVLRVRALGRRRRQAPGRILRASGIELDPIRRSVTHDGRVCELSAKEFAVLEALLLVSPGVLSAEQLLEQVWDENADPFTKTVAVTISRLRHRLGEPPVIETIPGVGYRVRGATS